MKLKYSITLFFILSVLNNFIFAKTFDHFKIGQDTAPVVVYEYVSFSCPACAVFNQKTMSKVKQDYVAKGLVQIVFIDVVIMHPQLDFFSHGLLHTIKNKNTVEKLIAVIFENQQKWATSKDPKNEIANYARLLGASSEEIEEAMNSKELYSWLKQTNEDLKKIKLEGTPTLIITKRGDDVTNYKDRFVGVVDYSTVKNSIDKVLKK